MGEHLLFTGASQVTTKEGTSKKVKRRWSDHFAIQDNNLGITRRSSGSVEFYECNYCGKQYACRHTCEGHVNKHHLARQPYKCQMCYKPFYYYSSMVRHMKTCLSFKCYICGAVMDSRLLLESHLGQVHSSQ
ncbi:hypothetical protein BaRGS_00027472 [Batillaria attramentaria]|uniref:C2H2-type domain-containing protein n=1 Tax=Batillaria attramentaria TaxID=370345 RepID=A0ABD0K2B0_9CAEN